MYIIKNLSYTKEIDNFEIILFLLFNWENNHDNLNMKFRI